MDLAITFGWLPALRRAKTGRSSDLTALLRSHKGDVPLEVREYLADILEGKAKLSKSRDVKRRIKDIEASNIRFLHWILTTKESFHEAKLAGCTLTTKGSVVAMLAGQYNASDSIIRDVINERGTYCREK